MGGEWIILVVDDDQTTRFLLERALARAGYRTEGHGDGAVAYARLEALQREGKGALLLLDYEMPRFNGAQLCEIIRGHGNPAVAQTPVLFLTSHADEACEVACLEAGGDDFIPKPVRLPQLKARIDTLLRTAEMRRTLAEQNRQLEQWRAHHERDLDAAQRVQQAILPAELPTLPGWAFAARYEPFIQVGGDFFDWVKLPDGRLMVWMADATGHGASGALLTSFLKLTFRDAVAVTVHPGEVLQRAGAALQANFQGRALVTAVCLLLDPRDGTCALAGAGHPPALLFRQDAILPFYASAPPLGFAVANRIVKEEHATLRPGDLLLLVTDGVYSAVPTGQGERLDFHHFLQRYERSQPHSAQKALESCFRLPSSHRFDDDATAFAIQRLK